MRPLPHKRQLSFLVAHEVVLPLSFQRFLGGLLCRLRVALQELTHNAQEHAYDADTMSRVAVIYVSALIDRFDRTESRSH